MYQDASEVELFKSKHYSMKEYGHKTRAINRFLSGDSRVHLGSIQLSLLTHNTWLLNSNQFLCLMLTQGKKLILFLSLKLTISVSWLLTPNSFSTCCWYPELIWWNFPQVTFPEKRIPNSSFSWSVTPMNQKIGYFLFLPPSISNRKNTSQSLVENASHVGPTERQTINGSGETFFKGSMCNTFHEVFTLHTDLGHNLHIHTTQLLVHTTQLHQRLGTASML